MHTSKRCSTSLFTPAGSHRIGGMVSVRMKRSKPLAYAILSAHNSFACKQAYHTSEVS